jgi:hypothetical protein
MLWYQVGERMKKKITAQRPQKSKLVGVGSLHTNNTEQLRPYQDSSLDKWPK